MCQAVTEGFAALRAQGVGGLPRNLAVLHNRRLRWLAVRYWARSMRSIMGELCFAAHARHAEAEMRALAHDVMARVGERPGTASLGLLLDQRAQSSGTWALAPRPWLDAAWAASGLASEKNVPTVRT